MKDGCMSYRYVCFPKIVWLLMSMIVSQTQGTCEESNRFGLYRNYMQLLKHTEEQRENDWTLMHISMEKAYWEWILLTCYFERHSCFIQNENGDTPLHLLLEKKRSCVNRIESLVQKIVNNGYHAITSIKNNHGNTLLHYAAKHGYTKIAELLITHGSEINAQNSMGDTPLHNAAHNNHGQIVQLLRYCRADESMKNNAGNTYKDYTRKKLPGRLRFHTKKNKSA